MTSQALTSGDLRSLADLLLRAAEQMEVIGTPSTVDGHKVHQDHPFDGRAAHAALDSCPVLTCLEWAKVKRFDRHLDEHGCSKHGGFGNCPTAMELFSAQPDAMKVLIG